MRKLFNDYGELTILGNYSYWSFYILIYLLIWYNLDATYGLNSKKYCCYIIVVVDNNGNTQVVAVALTAHETSVTFNQVLQFFTSINPASKVQTILSDKDMVEAIGFKQFFPQAHLLCTWHTNETFKKHFKHTKRYKK